jgi:hypothetical protein
MTDRGTVADGRVGYCRLLSAIVGYCRRSELQESVMAKVNFLSIRNNNSRSDNGESDNGESDNGESERNNGDKDRYASASG